MFLIGRIKLWIVKSSLVALQIQSKLLCLAHNCHINLVDLEAQVDECLGKLARFCAFSRVGKIEFLRLGN